MQREGFGRAALILALILAAVLAVLLVRHQRQERQRDAALTAMTEQAAPLEREIAQLERELVQAERRASEQTRTAFFAVGYQITETSDVDLAVRHAEAYGFTPVFVLDPTAGRYRSLVRAVRDVPCEVVLTAEPCTEEALAARPDLSEAQAVDTAAFLLDGSEDSPELLDAIAGAGYSCAVRYADSGENAVLDNGLVTLSYSRVKSRDFSVRNRLSKASEQAQVLLFVFDLAALHDGTLKEADIEADLELIFAGKDSGDAQYGTVTQGIAEVKASTEAQAMSRAELETFVTEQQQRIDAIRAELETIYAQWNREDNG